MSLGERPRGLPGCTIHTARSFLVCGYRFSCGGKRGWKRSEKSVRGSHNGSYLVTDAVSTQTQTRSLSGYFGEPREYQLVADNITLRHHTLSLHCELPILPIVKWRRRGVFLRAAPVRTLKPHSEERWLPVLPRLHWFLLARSAMLPRTGRLLGQSGWASPGDP